MASAITILSALEIEISVVKHAKPLVELLSIISDVLEVEQDIQKQIMNKKVRIFIGCIACSFVQK